MSGLSSVDDFPFHQNADVISHVGTSDRNFYDRYYFNLHASNGDLFMVMGMGEYPNLGVKDAFAVARRGNGHHVVRASSPLGDRADTKVGPIGVQIERGLENLRFYVEESDNPIAMDVKWTAAMPAYLEPRQTIRRHGRALFDTSRFAQTGHWEGSLRIGKETFKVSPDSWKGARDRSWGVRPIGEAEPPGIHAGEPAMKGMWNYAPMQFDDYSIMCICNEHDDGERVLEEGVRIWHDRSLPPEQLGRVEHQHQLNKDKTFVEEGMFLFPDAPGGALSFKATPMEHLYVMVGTGYGLENDWRHGMYHGKNTVVQKLSLNMDSDQDRMFGLVDCATRFESSGGDVGYGLFEWMFLGPFAKYGIK
jgi:hypothetical protein